MDILADALRVSGARRSVGTRMDAGGTWGLWLDDHAGATLHAVTAGAAWLNDPSRPLRLLKAGDVVLVPAQVPHGLASEPGVSMGACDAASAARARTVGTVMRLGSAPVQTRMLTLHYEQDMHVSAAVLGALTEPLFVTGNDNPSLDATVRLLVAELAHPQFGTTAAVNSLVDLLLVQFVRAWLGDHQTERPPSVLAAIADPIARDALALLHERPERPWTTATLASAIQVSRATLSRRFPAATGETPGAYLTRWRMDLAAIQLRETNARVDAVATAVGYTSAHAFSRAFRRCRGLAPSEYRASVRADA